MPAAGGGWVRRRRRRRSEPACGLECAEGGVEGHRRWLVSKVASVQDCPPVAQLEQQEDRARAMVGVDACARAVCGTLPATYMVDLALELRVRAVEIASQI